MRARALKFNVIAGLLSEFFTLISGLILPRLILTTFGSASNGLVSSIGQFLGFSIILRSGLGAVSRAALYKPIAEKNIEQISSVMVATQSYMRKVAMMIAGYILSLAVLYPLIVKGEFEWGFVFTMVLVLGSTTFADNFFGIKAIILLQADQKYYIHTLSSLVSSIISFLISVLLIKLNCSLLVVKCGATVGILFNPIILNIYVRKNYNINWKAEKNNLAIKQRWSAFAQQMATIINDNVDLVLLTFFVALKEVSVYTVYFMIVNNIYKIVNSFTTGINSTFGDMIAKKETDNLRKTFSFFEWGLFAMCAVVFAVTAIMIVPFIRIYTHSVEDVNYIRPLFAFAMTVAAMLKCMKTPYQTIAEAAGRFKETRNSAIIEIIVNLVVSIMCLYFFGIIGVIIGTICASLYRITDLIFFSYKNILKIPIFYVLRTFLLYILVFLVVVVVAYFIKMPVASNYLTWALWACVFLVGAVLIVVGVSVVNNRRQLAYLMDRIKRKRIKK